MAHIILFLFQEHAKGLIINILERKRVFVTTTQSARQSARPAYTRGREKKAKQKLKLGKKTTTAAKRNSKRQEGANGRKG